MMMDLTKIEKPFGLLDDETQAALKAWPHGWQMYDEDGWVGWDPTWRKAGTYRAKPAPLVPDSIDWSHVAPKFNYMARGDGGVAWVYSMRPEVSGGTWIVDAGQAFSSDILASYRHGTVDWRDSLVVRPGHEEAAQ